jgi:hypothetical protein
MGNKPLHAAGVIIAILLLAACNGGVATPGEADLEVNETSVSENTVAEPIYLNNCGNPASVEQVSEHSQTITIEGGATLGFSAQVVNGSVEGKYSSTKGVSKSQKVTAAPNTNMKFVLLWTEQVSEGTVTVDSQSGQATYRVSVPISVELSSAEDLGCASTSQTSVSTSFPTDAPATALPVMTITPMPASACATVNEQPRENTVLHRGQSFRVSFTVVNTGTTVWPEDLVLDISSNPYGTVDSASLPMKVPRVQPGDSINVGPFDAKAPNKDGHYVVDFELGDGFCWPYIAFDVVK